MEQQRRRACALSLAAALTIYTLDAQTRIPVSLRPDLGSGRFRGGATVYEASSPRAIVCDLLVQRAHVGPAIELIKHAGLPFPLTRPEAL